MVYTCICVKAINRKNTALSENNINKLAKTISPSCIIDIGLAMNYKMAEIEQIESKSSSLNDKRRVIFDLINGWCEKNITDGFTVNEIKENLLNILTESACNDAATLLQDNNSKNK